MRVRLIVSRHALPDVKLVWNVDIDSNPTTSRFLETVNEIVPIESYEWGLEDYAVELKSSDGSGFELLHFQPLATVLKEDDTIVIRPLLTQDIRQRRLSGRHQISSDGKRLVDGIAFGRPRLKAPRDRPDINIPPRKRRRVLEQDPEDQAHDGDYDEGFHIAGTGEPLLLTGLEGQSDGYHVDQEHGDSDKVDSEDELELATGISRHWLVEQDASGGEPEQEDDDEDSDSSDDDQDMEEEDLDDELGDLLDDIVAHQEPTEQEQHSSPPADSPVQQTAEPSPQPTINKSPRTRLMDLATLDKLARLGDAFPQVSVGVREVALMNSAFDEELAYMRLRQDFHSHLSLTAMLERHRLPASPSVTSSQHLSSKPSAPSHALESDEDSDDESDQLEPMSWISHFDTVGLPAGSIATGTALSSMATLKKFHDEALASASTPKASVDEEPPSKRRKTDIHARGSDDGSRMEPPSKKTVEPVADTSSEYSSDTSSEEESSSDEDENMDEGPAPLRVAKIRSRAHKIVDVSSDSDTSSSSDPGSDSSSDSESESSSDDDKAEADSDAQDGHKSSSSSESESESESESSSESDSDSAPEEQATTERPVPFHTAGSLQSPQSASKEREAPADETTVAPGSGMRKTQRRNTRRRIKKMHGRQASGEVPAKGPVVDWEQDLEARKQALLSSLGVSADGSQPVEEPQGQASDVLAADPESGTVAGSSFGSTKPANTATLSFASTLPTEADISITKDAIATPEDDNSWRDKIVYTAEECCEEGVELSEPPFPFVQRWDPQQQTAGYQNRGKGKRTSRNQSQFYEDGVSGGKKHKFADTMDDGEDVTLHYDDPVAEDEAAAEDTPTVTGQTPQGEKCLKDGNGQVTDIEDLPSLPSDLTTLDALHPGSARPGMVITWKKYILNTTTNWQPEIVNLTAIVIKPTDDVTDIEVMLARRDLATEAQPKTFDDEGNRVYDRFEAIDLDGDGDENGGDGLEEGNGYRTLKFAELIDPRVVQYPLAPMTENPDAEMKDCELASPATVLKEQQVGHGEDSHGEANRRAPEPTPSITLSGDSVGHRDFGDIGEVALAGGQKAHGGMVMDMGVEAGVNKLST